MVKSRTSKSALFRMIQVSPMPIYAVGRDMKVLYCNQALCDLTNHDDEFITELTCVYQTATDQPPSLRLAAGLCPPPDCFQGTPTSGWISIPQVTSSGTENKTDKTDNPAANKPGFRETEFRRATFVPNHPDWQDDTDDQEVGVLVFVHGQPMRQPEFPKGNPESPNCRDLHSAISQMQYDSASSISIDCLVGKSPESNKTRRQVALAGQEQSGLKHFGTNVMIVGPRGSGRQKVAPLIHFANGPELAGPLIPIKGSFSDVESIQETIKELYRSHKQYPDEPLGRVFLSDVDQLSEAAQRELIGFLQLPDFRLPLLATTIPDGRRRVLPELWDHLSTLLIELHPLSERRQDIPFLAQSIIEQFNNSGHAQIAGIDDETMSALVRYSWPGELDELTNALDEACRNTTTSMITTGDLPHHLRIALRLDSSGNSAGSQSKTAIDLDKFLAEIEDDLIRRAVAHTGGNKSEAARILGISRPRLLRRWAAIEGSNSSSNSGDEDTPEFIEETDASDGPDKKDQNHGS